MAAQSHEVPPALACEEACARLYSPGSSDRAREARERAISVEECGSVAAAVWYYPGMRRLSQAILTVSGLSGGAAGSLVMAALLVATPSAAAQTGKDWSQARDGFFVPGHTYAAIPDRLEIDENGMPMLSVEALGGIGNDLCVLRWQDSTWVTLSHLGYATKGVRPFLSSPGSHYLMWSNLDEVMTTRRESYLSTCQLVGGVLSQPDTIGLIYLYSLVYAGAASTTHRWAVSSDFGDLRLWRSGNSGNWIEFPVDGRGDRGAAAGALNDSTALIVWRGQNEGAWAGVLQGTQWILGPPPPIEDPLAGALRLRPRPSGGYWLSWATIDDWVGVASYRDGVWSEPQRIYCNYLSPESHYSQSAAEMSLDDEEYPAVTWMASSSTTGVTSVCVSVPDATGFTTAINLPGTEQAIAPVIARDANGDVWVAWEAAAGMGWAHTYTRATTTRPTVGVIGKGRIINWSLSEPASNSWWTVERSQDSGPYQAVARLKAGPQTNMVWLDTAPAPGALRYRIRRDCTDAAYVWFSEESVSTADVDPGRLSGKLELRRSVGSAPDLGFSVSNAAAGPAAIEMFDVRGAMLQEQHFNASGTGTDSLEFHVDGKGLRSGLFFFRAKDSLGNVSTAIKVAILR
jgi:hypothetical protein